MEVQNEDNLDLAYNKFENIMRQALDSEAPMGIVQPTGSYKSWLSENTKDTMKLRDAAVELSRRTQLDRDWT